MPLSPQVAIQRRFNNVWEDDKRQLQMDMFLGLKQKDYYPLTYSLPPGQGIYYKVGKMGFRALTARCGTHVWGQGIHCKVWEVWHLILRINFLRRLVDWSLPLLPGHTPPSTL